MLNKWENAVVRINKDGQLWRATKFSFICSHHFEHHDYIIPPSSGKTCRLKKHAIPSVFSTLEQPNAMHLSNEERNRLGIRRKHPLPPDDPDDMSPAKKIDNNLKMNHKKSQLTKKKNRKRSQICSRN